jgi:hypothetical protein
VIVLNSGELNQPAGGKASLQIDGAGGDFPVSFNLVPGVSRYTIPTDRLWFAGWLGTAPLRVTTADSHLQVSVERRAAPPSELY